MKERKSRRHLLDRQADGQPRDDGRERVEHVVPAGQIEAHAAEIFSFMQNGEVNARAVHLDLARAVVRLMVDGVGDDLAAERLSDVSHVLVVKAQDGVAAGLYVFQKFAKCLANVRERAIVIEMIVLDVRDDGDVRPEL